MEISEYQKNIKELKSEIILSIKNIFNINEIREPLKYFEYDDDLLSYLLTYNQYDLNDKKYLSFSGFDSIKTKFKNFLEKSDFKEIKEVLESLLKYILKKNPTIPNNEKDIITLYKIVQALGKK